MKPSDINYIVIHCSATPASMDVSIKDVDRWHREKGWRKVGYHYFIDREGNCSVGRSITEPGAHVKYFNSQSLGVCLAGGMNADMTAIENNFTEKQLTTLRYLVVGLKFYAKNAEVCSHYDLDSKKECPSFDVKKYLKDFNNENKNAIGNFG